MRTLVTILTFLLVIQSFGQTVTITVTLSGATQASSSIAPTKYNKQSVFMFEVDDRLPAMRSAYAVMHGGQDPFTGKTYPGYTFTDGCGNNIGYRCGFAINVVANGGTTDLESTGGSLTTSYITWSEAKTYIQNNFCPIAHGWQHNEVAGWPGFVQNIDKCVKATYDSTNALGVPFVLRNWITPNADNGYLPAAEQQRFLSGTSTNDLDGYPTYPTYNSTNNFTTVDVMNKQGFVFEKRDYTGNNSRSADVTYFNSKIDNFLSQSSSTNRTVMRFFSHQIDSVDGFNAIIGHLASTASDRTWVCSAPEFFDYLEATRRYVKSEVYSGNTLTITLDPQYFPDANRYRDLSLTVSTNGNITGVSVSGADNYSWSNTNKLINIFKKKTSGYTRPSLTFTENSSFPFNSDGFYSNNPNAQNYSQFYDGDTLNYVSVHSSLVRTPDQVVYEFPDSAGVILRNFQVHNHNWSTFSGPTTFYAERKVDGQLITLGTFDNSQTQDAWTVYTPPNTFVCNRIIAVAQGAGTRFGTEWQATVDRINYTEPTTFKPRTPSTVEQVTGLNDYPYDLYDNGNGHINTVRYNQLSRFKLQRMYLDRKEIHVAANEYAVGRSLSGWDLDSILTAAKNNNITTIITLKDTLQYTYEGWPNSGGYHPPRVYGTSATDPASYVTFAKEWFQISARYGSNTSIALSKIHPRTSGQFYENTVAKVGMNLPFIAEPFNEPDVFWRSQDYMTGDEIAAYLSACYDGDKGKLGDTVGIKFYNPNIKVFFSGLATPSPDAVRMAIAWCKIHRGYNPDGSVNVCWDALNYHDYSNDGSGQYGASATRALPVEISGVLNHAKSFVHVADKYLGGMPAYLTEMGVDSAKGSPIGAWPIGSKTQVQVAADWLIRATQAYSAVGLNGTVIYQSTDDIGGWEDHISSTTTLPVNVWTNVPLNTGEGSRFSDSTWIYLEMTNTGSKDLILRAFPVDANTIKVFNWSGSTVTMNSGDKIRGPYYNNQQFNHMGVLNQDESLRTISWFTTQQNSLLTGYKLTDTSSSIYHYTKTGANDIYSAWSPTMTGATKSYTIPLQQGSSVVVHSLQDGSLTTNNQSYTVGAGGFTVISTETPLYVEVVTVGGGGGGGTGSLSGKMKFKQVKKFKIK